MNLLAAESMFLLPVLALAQMPHIFAPVVISGTGAQPCLSKELLESNIFDPVVSILQEYYHRVEQCGDGVWYRLVSVNMSDPLSQCLDDWVEENVGGVRACGRGTVDGSCRSLVLRNGERQYTKICGRVIGYQSGSTDAFAFSGRRRSLNEIYVDGLSITYGSPRQHVWTYAAGVREGPSTYTGSNCPCSRYPGIGPPSYIGKNWYCESGNPNQTIPTTLLSSDPLWDGEDCEGTCCSNGKTPPWFSVKLPRPTNEAVEARICADENNENIIIREFEIYIQ